jgi:hypothetical protein
MSRHADCPRNRTREIRNDFVHILTVTHEHTTSDPTAGSAAITPSDFLEVIVSPQQWEVANITGRRWNFGGLRR